MTDLKPLFRRSNSPVLLRHSPAQLYWIMHFLLLLQQKTLKETP